VVAHASATLVISARKPMYDAPMSIIWAVVWAIVGAVVGFLVFAILSVGSDADDQMDYIEGFRKGKEAAEKERGDPN
jgi:Na+/H+ antiporter NhaC